MRIWHWGLFCVPHLLVKDSSILPTPCEAGERSTDRSTAAVMWQTINQYNKIHVSRSTRFSSLKNKNNVSYEKLKQQKPYNAAYKRTMQMCASLTSHCLVFHAVSVITAGNIKQENQPSCTLNKSIGSLLLPRRSTDE